MANLFTSAHSTLLILRRDLEDVLDEMELPWRVRREMDRLFAESTSPMSLWRNVEYLLEDFAAPFVVRRRIETVFARFFAGRGGESFHTLNGSNHVSQFTNHSSQFAPSGFHQSPQFTNAQWSSNYGSQWQNPQFGTSYGSQWQNPQFGHSVFGQNPYLTGSLFGHNPYFTGGAFGHNPYFTSRDQNAWTTLPRGDWSTSRYNNGVRSNTYGQFGSTFGNTSTFGNAWGPTYGQYGNAFGNQAFGGQFGNQAFGGQFGNQAFGNQAFGNPFGGQFGNQAYGNPFGGQYGNPFGVQDFVPPVELIERDGEFVVRVELAGVREQDVEIRANEQMLTIRGERRERFDNEVARHVGAYEYSERRYGTFSRTVTLPQGIDAAHIHAVFRDGVLELRIPQAETYRARRIPIGRIDEQRINDGQPGMHGRPHVS